MKTLLPLFALLLALVGTDPARAGGCDGALILGIDVSGSIDAKEMEMQLRGTAAALRSPHFHSLATDGPDGRIVVAVVVFGTSARAVVPWTIVEEPAHANGIADRIEAGFHRGENESTSIVALMEQADEMFRHLPCPSRRKVLDISGDGTDSGVVPMNYLRDRLVSNGIVINGLVIAEKGQPTVGGYYGHEDRTVFAGWGSLKTYFETLIKGGEGSFVLEVEGYEAYGDAILAKLIREMS